MLLILSIGEENNVVLITGNLKPLYRGLRYVPRQLNAFSPACKCLLADHNQAFTIIKDEVCQNHPDFYERPLWSGFEKTHICSSRFEEPEHAAGLHWHATLILCLLKKQLRRKYLESFPETSVQFLFQTLDRHFFHLYCEPQINSASLITELTTFGLYIWYFWPHGQFYLK